MNVEPDLALGPFAHAPAPVFWRSRSHLAARGSTHALR